MKTNHTETRQRQAFIRTSDLTPTRMNLAIGDVVYIFKPAALDERELGRKKRVPVKILKLYRNHALCQVGGKFNEAFTYAELAQARLKEGGAVAK